MYSRLHSVDSVYHEFRGIARVLRGGSGSFHHPRKFHLYELPPSIYNSVTEPAARFMSLAARPTLFLRGVSQNHDKIRTYQCDESGERDAGGEEPDEQLGPL